MQSTAHLVGRSNVRPARLRDARYNGRSLIRIDRRVFDLNAHPPWAQFRPANDGSQAKPWTEFDLQTRLSLGDDTARNVRVRWISKTSNRITNFEFSGTTPSPRARLRRARRRPRHSPDRADRDASTVRLAQSQQWEQVGALQPSVIARDRARRAAGDRRIISEVIGLRRVEHQEPYVPQSLMCAPRSLERSVSVRYCMLRFLHEDDGGGYGHVCYRRRTHQSRY